MRERRRRIHRALRFLGLIEGEWMTSGRHQGVFRGEVVTRVMALAEDPGLPAALREVGARGRGGEAEALAMLVRELAEDVLRVMEAPRSLPASSWIRHLSFDPTNDQRWFSEGGAPGCGTGNEEATGPEGSVVPGLEDLVDEKSSEAILLGVLVRVQPLDPSRSLAWLHDLMEDPGLPRAVGERSRELRVPGREALVEVLFEGLDYRSRVLCLRQLARMGHDPADFGPLPDVPPWDRHLGTSLAIELEEPSGAPS